MPVGALGDFIIIEYSKKNLLKIIKVAKKIIKEGELIVYPTDTIYGIGGDATSKKAVDKIFKIKHRPKNEPISILVSDFKMLEKYAKINENQRKILKKLPGKYTFILNPRKKLPVSKSNIGFRIPNHWCIILSKEFGKPITTTSANIHGKPTPETIKEINKMFKDSISLYIDVGKLFGRPSKVIDITRLRSKVIRN